MFILMKFREKINVIKKRSQLRLGLNACGSVQQGIKN